MRVPRFPLYVKIVRQCFLPFVPSYFFFQYLMPSGSGISESTVDTLGKYMSFSSDVYTLPDSVVRRSNLSEDIIVIVRGAQYSCISTYAILLLKGFGPCCCEAGAQHLSER